jgi:hypothetical protein
MTEPDSLEEPRQPPLGPWASYWADLRWSVRVWSGAKWFVALTAAVWAFLAMSFKVPGLDLLAYPVYLGFLGTQRIFYLRMYRGLNLEPREILPLMWKFLGRFLVLELLFVGPLVVVGIIIGIAIRATHGGQTIHISNTSILAVAIPVTFIGDFAFTFVVPALCLSTRSATEAVGIGLRMIRTTWPSSAWYLLTPGLTVSVLAIVFPHSGLGAVGVVVWVAATGVLGLAFKGAVVPFYLRLHPEVENDGATGDKVTSINWPGDELMDRTPGWALRKPEPGSPMPGWYGDPHGKARIRWWDGRDWTEHTHD